MSPRQLASVGVLATVIAVVSLAPVALAGQAQTSTADTWTPPRTLWGEPDLQGIWDFRTLTPLERPIELAGREFFTEEEAAEREQRAEQIRVNRFSFNFEPAGTTLTEDRRTSLIVDPPDGRIPPLTPKAQEQSAAMFAAVLRTAHGPEDRTLWERCILGRTSGPPMIPSAFQQYGIVQLFQTPGYVVVLNEAIHAVRIVPLDGRPHLGPHIRQWKGDSRGRWEGNTLVVDTTNFNDRGRWRGRGGSETHLVERFTRVDANTLLYEFTVDDRTTFIRPWSAAVPMKKTEGPVFEFACHEGNEGILGILSAARADETRPTIEVHGVDVVEAGALVPLEAEAAAHGGARVERVEWFFVERSPLYVPSWSGGSRFFVDGAVVGVDREAPYEVTWTAGGTGRHIVRATIHDSLGKVAQSAPVTIFVGIRALERSITRSEDEAEELPAGLMLLDNSGRLGDQVVAMRFTDIRIPRGAEIEKAHVQFTADDGGVNTEPTDLIIQAELAGDAVAFTEVRQNISLRKRTAASVNWSPEPWEVAGERSLRQRTPDLAALIQEVVDRPDWHEGNALVLLISGSGERVAWSYGFARQRQHLEHAPRLYIELAEANP